MATITATRLAYKQTGNVTDCTCMRIVRTDGTTLRFVCLDKDISMTLKNVNGAEVAIGQTVTYQSISVADFSAFGSTIGEFGQVDLEGAVSTLGIKREDLVKGLYDRARVYIFYTNYNRPIEDEEAVTSGLWGEVTLIDGRFIAKFSSLLDILNTTTGRIYKAPCDAQLGSFRCGVNLNSIPNWQASTAYTVANDSDKRIGIIVKHTAATVGGTVRYFKCTVAGTSGASEPSWNTTLGATTVDGTVTWEAIYPYKVTTTVTGITSKTVITVGNNVAVDWFTNGYLQVVTGDNTGMKIPIENGGASLTLAFEPTYNWTLGDQVILTVGCTKTRTACKDKFENVLNYQGFAKIPGRVALNVGTNF